MPSKPQTIHRIIQNPSNHLILFVLQRRTRDRDSVCEVVGLLWFFDVSEHAVADGRAQTVGAYNDIGGDLLAVCDGYCGVDVSAVGLDDVGVEADRSA